MLVLGAEKVAQGSLLNLIQIQESLGQRIQNWSNKNVGTIASCPLNRCKRQNKRKTNN